MNAKTIPTSADAPFELGDDEILEAIEGFEAGEQKPSAQAAKPVAPAVPEMQKQAPEAPTKKAAPFDEPAHDEHDSGVVFETEDLLESALATRGTKTGQVTASGVEDDDSDAEDKGIAGLLKKHMKLVVGGVVLTVVGLALAPKSPVPGAHVAAPVAAQTAPAVSAAPATAVVPVGAPTAPVAGGVQPPAIDIASMGASPDGQPRVSLEVDKDFKALPPSEQTCSNPALTSYEQHQCTRYTQQVFFKCTEGGGRRWNVSVPGCEQL